MGYGETDKRNIIRSSRGLYVNRGARGVDIYGMSCRTGCTRIDKPDDATRGDGGTRTIISAGGSGGVARYRVAGGSRGSREIGGARTIRIYRGTAGTGVRRIPRGEGGEGVTRNIGITRASGRTTRYGDYRGTRNHEV